MMFEFRCFVQEYVHSEAVAVCVVKVAFCMFLCCFAISQVSKLTEAVNTILSLLELRRLAGEIKRCTALKCSRIL